MSGPAPQWRDLSSPEDVADALVELFERRGGATYDEVLSQTDHARQTGALAQGAGASDDLVVASFLHDVGHLLTSDQVAPCVDRHHEVAGERLLARWFPPTVTTAVRLHVAAKRYLCTVDAAYADGLSAGSTRSLALQGGPMTAAEVVEFEAVPGSRDALDLRRWDDRAKVPGAPAPTLDAYRELIVGVLSTSSR